MDIFIVDEHFKGTLESQLEQSVSELLRIVKEKGQFVKNILKLNIFLQSDNEEELNVVSEALNSIIKKEFSQNIPSYTLVSQPSLSGNDILLEGLFLEKNADIKIERNTFYKHPYIVLSSSKDHPRMVLSGGINMPVTGDMTFECQRVFDFAEQLLLKEDMDFSNISGQWNYIPSLMSHSKYGDVETQNTDIFKNIRSLYLSPELFPNGIPELTVTGTTTGNIIIDFVALSGTEDPGNITGYGRYFTGSLPAGALQDDIESQTQKLIRDILEKSKDKDDKVSFSLLRIYLKNKNNLLTVRNIIDENINADNFVYIKADMHDDDIKIHIEAFV